jgi:hypothetical protein
MKRISIGFYDEVCDQLEQIRKEDGLSTLAQCVREMVDLAIRIRTASKKSTEKMADDPVIAAVNELKKLFKSNMNWSLETRLLARFLVENHTSGDGEKRTDILDQYKKSSIDYIQGLYGEKIE